MRAAKTFTYGFENERVIVRMGEEIPEEILDDEDFDESLVLENVAKSNPSSLSREQLLVMAGLSAEDSDDGASEDEMTEEELREALGELNTKRDVVDWAQEVLGLELDSSDTREKLEDSIVAAYFETEEEEEN